MILFEDEIPKKLVPSLIKWVPLRSERVNVTIAPHPPTHADTVS